jgi:membrane-anchored mycosin MYCP
MPTCGRGARTSSRRTLDRDPGVTPGKDPTTISTLAIGTRQRGRGGNAPARGVAGPGVAGPGVAGRRPAAAGPRHARAWLAAPGLAGLSLALTLGAAGPARADPARPALAARPVAATRPGQPVSSLEWWLRDWDIQSKVWPLTKGAGVTVAILDSGVQADLPDIRAAVVPGGDTTGARTNGMTDDEGPGGHGTGLASLIAGQGVGGGLLGIAPAAKILPVRVGGLNGVDNGGTPQTVAAGIRYAVQRGAQVINVSIYTGDAPSSGSCDPVEQDAVAYALQHNVVVVVAAGNTGTSGNPAYEPASCAGVLAVGAVGPSLKLWPQSEQQPYVEVTAPGADIATLGQDGGNWFANGTSCSAAFVSGEAALIRSRYPSMPWYQVVQRIINTALPEGSAVPNVQYGFGIIRIPGAVNASAYKVAADAPNPVYLAYQGWLTSAQGQRYTHPGRARPVSAHRTPAAAPSSGGGLGLAAVIAVVVVVAAGGIALSVVVVRRRRRAREPSGTAG